jgi:hypothetical protein
MSTHASWGVERTETDNWIGPLRMDGKVARVVCHIDRENLRRPILARNDAEADLIAAAPALCDALYRLVNEATGFLAMADPEIHGITNMRVMERRIEEARAVLAQAEGQYTS